MNYERFGIGVTFLVLLVILAFTAVSTGLAGVEIPSIVPEPAQTPNSFYEWCYQMGRDC